MMVMTLGPEISIFRCGDFFVLVRQSWYYHSAICLLSDGDRNAWTPAIHSQVPRSHQFKKKTALLPVAYVSGQQPVLLQVGYDIRGAVLTAAINYWSSVKFQASYAIKGEDATLKYVKMWNCHAHISINNVMLAS